MAININTITPAARKLVLEFNRLAEAWAETGYAEAILRCGKNSIAMERARRPIRKALAAAVAAFPPPKFINTGYLGLYIEAEQVEVDEDLLWQMYQGLAWSIVYGGANGWPDDAVLTFAQQREKAAKAAWEARAAQFGTVEFFAAQAARLAAKRRSIENARR